MPHKDPITETLRDARVKQGLSVLELADILKIPADRIYKWDQGKSAPKFEDRKKVDKWLAGKNFQQEKPTEAPNEQQKPTGFVPAEELISVLKEQNDFLRRNFELSLSSIVEGQQQLGVQLKGLAWYNTLVASNGDQKKAEEAMLKINNKMAFYAGVGGEEGNHDKENTGSISGKRKS